MVITTHLEIINSLSVDRLGLLGHESRHNKHKYHIVSKSAGILMVRIWDEGGGTIPALDAMESVQANPGVDTKPDSVLSDFPGLSALKIDSEFKDLIPPLGEGERDDLKMSLQKEGCRDKLVICKLEDQYVLIDGHNRFEICKELGIPYKTTEIKVSNRTEAKIWIIKNQRARRNLNESQRAMLAVTLEALYGEAAKQRKGMRTDLGLNLEQSVAGRSAKKAAKDMGVSHQTVSYAKKVEKKGIPELARMVESGDIAVSAAAKLPLRLTISLLSQDAIAP
jgi:hypothetical protein